MGKRRRKREKEITPTNNTCFFFSDSVVRIKVLKILQPLSKLWSTVPTFPAKSVFGEQTYEARIN